MLFNAREFELIFSNQVLRKGLEFFERDKLSLIQRLPNNLYHFLIDGRFDLHVRKRGDKILSYSCSCEQSEFYSHFCAVLFYFQKETLGISVSARLEKGRKSLIKRNHRSLPLLMQPFEDADLADLLSRYQERTGISEESLNRYFSQYSTG